MSDNKPIKGGRGDPDIEAAFFGHKDVLDPAAVPTEPDAGPYRSPVPGRRALRRLQNQPAPPFDQIIDLIYEWRDHDPGTQFMQFMRLLMQNNANIADVDAIKQLRERIKAARMKKVQDAIDKLGLDTVERMLDLRKDDEP